LPEMSCLSVCISMSLRTRLLSHLL